jgi:Tfp pilus assembly protein PilO
MLRRVLTEHRLAVIALCLALVANVGVYWGVVFPLSERVADADNRAARADRTLQEARREFAAATGVSTSKERAEAGLKAFYADVLPADLSAAHRLTYLDLAQLARGNNLRILRRTATEAQERGSALEQLSIALVLEGQYANVRSFVHALETSPGFLIVDDVELDQPRDGEGALVLKLQVSTYYRAADHAG